MAKKKQLPTVSDQLRSIILNGPLTRYAISKASGVNQSQLHRFVNKTGRLTTDSMDAIGTVLRLRLVIQDEE